MFFFVPCLIIDRLAARSSPDKKSMTMLLCHERYKRKIIILVAVARYVSIYHCDGQEQE